MNEATRSHSKRVVIVGGGLAGLSAAEALARYGDDRFNVTVLEAKQVVGGRAGSFSDPATGETVDYCQHVAMGCCTNLIGLLQRCDLSEQMQRYDELLFLHPDHPPSRFAASRFLPAPLHLAGAVSALRYLSGPQRRQVRHGMLRLFRTRSDELADQTAHRWLVSAGQDLATIRDFWGVIIVSALGEQPEVVSMAAARKVFVDGFAAAAGASDVLIPRTPLADLFGRRLRDEIEKLGVQISTGKSVKQLSAEGGPAVATQDGERFAADHVIVAVPWHVTPSLLPRQFVPQVDRFANFPASPISGLHLWFDRQFTDRHHAVMVGTVAQWLFRQPWGDSSDPDSGCYYQIVISASEQARRIARAELVEIVLGELRHAFPAAGQAKLLRSRVVTDPNSVFSIRPQVDASRPAIPHVAGLAALGRRLDCHRLARHDGRGGDQRSNGGLQPGHPRGTGADRDRSGFAPGMAGPTAHPAVVVCQP